MQSRVFCCKNSFRRHLPRNKSESLSLNSWDAYNCISRCAVPKAAVTGLPDFQNYAINTYFWFWVPLLIICSQPWKYTSWIFFLVNSFPSLPVSLGYTCVYLYVLSLIPQFECNSSVPQTIFLILSVSEEEGRGWASSNQNIILINDNNNNNKQIIINNYVVSLWFKSNIKNILALVLLYGIGKNLTNLWLDTPLASPLTLVKFCYYATL